MLSIPEPTARELLRRTDALVAIAAPRIAREDRGRLAPFSSWGLAFDGGIKPDLVAPGVGLVTAEPGTTDDGRSAFGTINGSSGAAAVVAGAAALLAEARPDAGAETLRALLIGGGVRLGGVPLPAQGAGLLDLGRSAAAELVADPPVVAFGRGAGDGRQARRVLRLHNVSTRRLTLFVASGQGRNPRVRLLVSPRRVEIEPGGTAELTLRTRPITIVHGDAVSGALTLTPVGGAAVRVPWAIVLRPARALLRPLSLSAKSFKPSESKPAIVVVRAGGVLRSPRGNEVVPTLRLDVELWTEKGKRLGLLARLRDLLPGRYAFGLTGRGPSGRVLKPGRYRLRVYAWPTGGGSPSVRSLGFAIK